MANDHEWLYRPITDRPLRNYQPNERRVSMGHPGIAEWRNMGMHGSGYVNVHDGKRVMRRPMPGLIPGRWENANKGGNKKANGGARLDKAMQSVFNEDDGA